MPVGWREWVALPDLGITKIKAKVDTGARTSCLHAFKVQKFTKAGTGWVRFWVHPVQNDQDSVIVCETRVIDRRIVSDSGGHREMRYVIASHLMLGAHTWPIELTLTNRDSMRFRMLLGRTAMAGRMIVIPDQSFLAGPPTCAS
ncbi:MAG: ATP-dependent zinc protease [Gammaproteobacteria bacterium]|nr:MAG: ATP-dependent zinc protease [Gammaproteobacteria bacterium]